MSILARQQHRCFSSNTHKSNRQPEKVEEPCQLHTVMCQKCMCQDEDELKYIGSFWFYVWIANSISPYVPAHFSLFLRPSLRAHSRGLPPRSSSILTYRMLHSTTARSLHLIYITLQPKFNLQKLGNRNRTCDLVS